MNTANLQLEGLLLAISALCATLKAKGILDDADIAGALTAAEAAAEKRCGSSTLSSANVDAVRFPIRFLRGALEAGPGAFDFCGIAAGVAASKQDRRAAAL